jgi:hypothetical protein
MCGESASQAAREDSHEQKKYDETGIVVSSCKHCVVPYAINMFKGESWTHRGKWGETAVGKNAQIGFLCHSIALAT